MLIDLKNIENSSPKKITIPDGTYTFSCVESELKTTKAGTGKYINIALICLNPQWSEKKMWCMFNIENPSKKAQDIGRSQLKDFLRSANVDDSGLNDPKDLIGLIVNASVTTEDNPQYGAKNVVTKWEKKTDTSEEADIPF